LRFGDAKLVIDRLQIAVIEKGDLYRYLGGKRLSQQDCDALPDKGGVLCGAYLNGLLAEARHSHALERRHTLIGRKIGAAGKRDDGEGLESPEPCHLAKLRVRLTGHRSPPG
jgi:hypothetical protein